MRSAMRWSVVCHAAVAATVSPLEKVLEILSELQQNTIVAGKEEQASFEKYARWCADTSGALQRTVNELSEERLELEASILTSRSASSEATETTQQMAATISAQEKSLRSAAAARNREREEFLGRDAELAEAVSTLDRASIVLERSLKDLPAQAEPTAAAKGFLQAPSAAARSRAPPPAALVAVARAMIAVVEGGATGLDAALVDDTVVVGRVGPAPATSLLAAFASPTTSAVEAVDASTSRGILETFRSLKDRALAERNGAQKQELKDQSAFQLLQLAGKDEIASFDSQRERAGHDGARAAEQLARASGALTKVRSDLAATARELGDVKQSCVRRSAAFERGHGERAEELAVLAKAKQIVSEVADNSSLLQAPAAATVSFIQLGVTATPPSPVSPRVASAAEALRATGVVALAQVAARMADSPFAEVRRMLETMVSKLTAEQGSEAKLHSWCVAENKKTKTSLSAKRGQVTMLRTRLASAQSAREKLAGEVQALLTAATEAESSIRAATAMRSSQKAQFLQEAGGLQAGIDACSRACAALRDYYGGAADGGNAASLLQQPLDEAAVGDDNDSTLLVQSAARAARAAPSGDGPSGAIKLLEVAEADFAKNLAGAKVDEESAASAFARDLEDSKVGKAARDQDVANKQGQIKALQARATETSADVDEAGEEKAAVEKYLDKLTEDCENTPASFEERQARRDKELDGLRSGLAALEA